MNESILKALMRLFAIVANVNKDGISTKSQAIVEAYLKQQVNTAQVEEYLKLFDEYLNVHHRNITRKDGTQARKRTSSNSVKVLMICHEINESLQQKEKFIVLFQLLEFIFEDDSVTGKEMDFVETVADTFNISRQEYLIAHAFVAGELDKLEDKTTILVIDKALDDDFYVSIEDPQSYYKHLHNHHLDKEIVVQHIESIKTFVFRYNGTNELFLNGHIVIPKRAYILDSGSIIKSSIVNPIYYNDVFSIFLKATSSSRIIYNAQSIEFKFKNSDNGLHNFNFSEESGQLIGIMGGSGVGKSTLVNILNGNIKPDSGKITINGLDLHANKDELEGVIGFVPQDDLLIEELTVYQNLYFNAKLCFSNFNETQLQEAVTKTLVDLDLAEIKDLTVGNPLNKFISGGQRKRLNIALELIRQPSILFVDEPTSGLSSMDSEMVMLLLKEQAVKGKLVIVNIHQPSSDIYKLFDKILVMDKGGRPVYNGNPIDAIVYFKSHANHVNAEEGQCMACGNVNPEQILQIVEAKVVNEYGKFTRTRKIAPEEWYRNYKEKIEAAQVVQASTEPLPGNHFKIPNRFQQFKVFFKRNLLSKLTNRQYMLINLLEAPLLALILGFFTKYISGTAEDPNAYIFSENENMPAYLFMAVIVSLFIGLTVSAEEIIKDRKILQRESFLNLSRISYINSKISYLFILSAIQTISFIAVGNLILEIQGMTWSYFLILFSATAFANMMGLNISAALNSVVTIYILIPFILVPQILLSGTTVSFNKLHKSITNPKYVPVVGDLMTSRWAYEALAVEQFKNNAYQKRLFDVQQKISYASFRSVFLIPQLESKLNQIQKNMDDPENRKDFKRDLKILQNELRQLQIENNAPEFGYLDQLNPDDFRVSMIAATDDYLDKFKKYFNKLQNKANIVKDERFGQMAEELGSAEAIFELKQKHHNKYVADLVSNAKEINKIIETETRLLQRKDPIYMLPESNWGRAHFFAPSKKIAGNQIDTFWFNIGFMWITTILLYFVLVFDLLRKLIENKFSFRK